MPARPSCSAARASSSPARSFRRLGALKAALPELELHLTASDDNESLRSGVDGVLRFQTPPFTQAERQETRILGTEHIGPVLRPDTDWLGETTATPHHRLC